MIYRYYLEIKNRFFLILISWVATLFVCYLNKELLLFLFSQPNLIYSNEIVFYFIFTDVKEIFSVYIQLIFFIGNQILFLYLMFHLIAFISFGLYQYEYYYLKLIFRFSLVFWCFSILILSKILLPISWNFFLSFQSYTNLNALNLHFEAKLSEYLNFYILFYQICTLYCQLFVGLVFLFEYIGVHIELLKKFRKFFYYFFIFFSTMVTPPDIISQILFSISIILIYELVILLKLVRITIKD